MDSNSKRNRSQKFDTGKTLKGPKATVETGVIVGQLAEVTFVVEIKRTRNVANFSRKQK